jgi:unsaturated chondroitin disaccharide hydrolase
MTTSGTHPSWLDTALEFCITKTRQNLATLTAPAEATRGGLWAPANGDGQDRWMNGYWLGLLWLVYAATEDPALAAAARDWGRRLLPQLDEQVDHASVFPFELGFVLGYRLTGDEALKRPALQAASTLSHRFNSHGQFIQAGNVAHASSQSRGCMIMDAMMTLDLLFWAGKETADPHLAEIAAAHARTALTHHLQPDGNAAHICHLDPQTGTFISPEVQQELSVPSCWSRGQAWGVYGFAECYRATGDPVFLNTSRRMMVYLWPRLPADLIPFCEFDSSVRDSSAASVLASGLLSLASLENDPTLASIWQNRAISILESLWETYTSRDTGEANLLLLDTRLTDEDLIYGDYYFVEALLRLSKSTLI